MMIRNYLKIAWRNLWRNKVFSAINIIGLAVGMAVCIVITLFVRYEESFDNLHTKNIYRLNEEQNFPGMAVSQKVAGTMFPMGPALKREFPEIKNFARLAAENKYQVTYRNRRLFLPQVLMADSSFLQMFDFKLIEGSRQDALRKPNSILLTQESAKKLFGPERPIGKTVIHYGGDTATYIVTGIIQNSPKNSHLQFDAIYSLATAYKPNMDAAWGRGDWLTTYLEIAPGADIRTLESKFPAFMERHMRGIKDSYKLFLLPLKAIHAGSTDISHDSINFQKFDGRVTNLFAIIAIVLLTIACINFVNLSTSISSDRAKEVGIRKSLGAHRFQLSLQFLIEALVLTFIALILSLLIVKAILPYVNNLISRDVSIILFSPSFILFLIIFTVLVGLVSGLYPSVYLSSFSPSKVLKGSVETGVRKTFFRNVLVVGQFSSAVFMMIATVFILKQLKFMQTQDPGFNHEQVVTIPLDDAASSKYRLFKQRLSASTLVSGVTAAWDVLGAELNKSGVTFAPANGPKQFMAERHLMVDPDYLDVYKIKLVEGKNFSTEKNAAGREYIINEALAEKLLQGNNGGSESSLIGSRFGFDTLGRITGIVKNFNFNSLHYKIESMFLLNIGDSRFNNISIKIKGGNTSRAISFIKSTWSSIFPDYPFEYQFMDDHFNEVYKADNQQSQIVGILSGLAIFISCMGLFGLASYSAQKRVKEIGVRKVLGASVQRIVLLLSGNFLKLVLLANLIACPFAWWAINHWLSDYAYRIEINWMIFVVIAFVSVLIALITISFQSIKAATANPVKSLRSE